MSTHPVFKYQTIEDAAEAGDLEELVLMHEYSLLPCADEAYWVQWCPLTPAFAAQNGHLECLQYAYVHGCLWDDHTTRLAATGGHIECLRFAHEHGCEWNDNCVYSATYDCLEYALTHGCPYDLYTMVDHLNDKMEAWVLDVYIDLRECLLGLFAIHQEVFATFPRLYAICQDKVQELKLHKQFAEIDARSLPQDVVEHILKQYF